MLERSRDKPNTDLFDLLEISAMRTIQKFSIIPEETPIKKIRRKKTTTSVLEKAS